MRMNRKLSLLLVCVMLLCTAFGNACAAVQTATVQGGWLVLRDAPSFSGNILASYPSGTIVTVTKQYGSWYAVTAPDNLSGYMLSNYLSLHGSTQPGTDETTEYTAYVTSANRLNVRLRSGPGTGYSVLASYAPGTICTVINEGTEWSRIRIGSLTGYMMNRFLTRQSSPVTVPPYTPVSPTAAPGEGYTVYVTSANGQGVNLRSGPGTQYQSIGFYSVGTQATMLSAGSIWSYISIGNRAGYMMTQFLSTVYVAPTQPLQLRSAYVISRNGRNVNLRSGPGKGYSVIRSFPVGTTLKVIVRGTEWYYIEISGMYGYMMKAFINDIQGPEPISPTSAEDVTDPYAYEADEDTAIAVTPR